MNDRRVVYTQDALTQLIQCHTAAPDPGAAVRSATRIRERLAGGVPPDAGAWPEGLFALDLDPLRVFFEVPESTHAVRVAAVGLLPGRAGRTRPGTFGPR